MSISTVHHAWCEANLPSNLPVEPPTDDESVTPTMFRGLLALCLCHNARANAYIAWQAQGKNEEGKVLLMTTPTYEETLAWVEQRAQTRQSEPKTESKNQ